MRFPLAWTRWSKPLGTSLPLSTLADLARSKSELITENALLRQQLIILKRQVKRPPISRTDRILLVLLSRVVRTWQQALLIVQPDTLLRWHRELFRFIFHEKQLQRVLNVYVAYFKRARPHQGIMQQLPEAHDGPLLPDHNGGKVASFSVLGGLHNDCRRVA